MFFERKIIVILSSLTLGISFFVCFRFLSFRFEAIVKTGVGAVTDAEAGAFVQVLIGNL